MVWVWIPTRPRDEISCPQRIAEAAMQGLIDGLILGAIFVGISEILRNVSLSETMHSVLRRAPGIGVATCMLMAIFTTFECTIDHSRGFHAPVNSFMAGALTGAILGANRNADEFINYVVSFALLFGILRMM